MGVHSSEAIPEAMPSLPYYDPNFRVTAATSENEKAIFIASFREHYAKAIGAKLCYVIQARAVMLEFVAHAVRAGLTIPDIFAMLTDPKGGILTRPEIQSHAGTAVNLIDYIKAMDVPEIYQAAGVPLERDFCQDPATGKWQPKNP
jgi:hypothetical protein